MKKLVSFILILALMLSCGAFALEGEYAIDDVVFYSENADIGLNRVFYEIFTGSFSDSDGDGTGDLRGIINRLDYLNDGDPESGLSLGVEGIWLTPVFPSPSYHKYDVTNYTAIDPSFGTLDDMRELVEECHRRGILVIIDLPINHTSKTNKWYTNFVNAHIVENPDNVFYDFYSWIPAGSAVPAGRHFTRVNGTEIMVETNFSDDMPEINFDSEYARKKVLEAAQFWLELGVDGFRFDAAKYIYYGDHATSAEFWTWFMSELKAIKPDIYAVAEVWDSDAVTARYTPAMNCFNFTTSQAEGLIAAAAKGGNVNKLTLYTESHINELKALNPDAMNISFIANHDTDRVAGYLTVATGRMQMAANLYLLAPGSPFIYYGEEIGLRGSRGGANTDANRRLAMLWGDGDTVKDPVGTTYDPKNQTPYSVSDLISNESGIYNYYKKVIMIRKANPEISAGEYRALDFTDTKLGGFISTLDGSSVCVLHNSTTKAITVDISAVTDMSFDILAAYVGAGEAEMNGSVITIGRQTSVVLRISGTAE